MGFERVRGAIADMLAAIRVPDAMLGPSVTATWVDIGNGKTVEQRSISNVRVIGGIPSNVVLETIVPDSDIVAGQFDPRRTSVLVASFPLDQGVLRQFGNTFHFDDVQWATAPGPGAPASDHRPSTRVASSNGAPVGRVSWIGDRPGEQVLQHMTAGAIAAGALLAALAIYAFANIRAEANRIIRNEQREAQLARTDFLTGLPNRLALSEETTRRLAALGDSGRPLGVVMIDLDGFKHINDSLGHHVGDAALTAIGQRLMECCPDGFVSRTGGDEFALLLPAATAVEIGNLAERAAEILRVPLLLEDGMSVPLGCSVGYCVAPTHGNAESELFRRADLALYRAKKEGRGRAHAFDAEIEASVNRRHALEGALRRAVDADRIDVMFQPLMSNEGDRVTGVEALARWTDAELGPISPVEFIPIAEETGLIVQLGEQVLRKSLLAGRDWTDISVSVNVSAQQIQRADMVATIERLLRECDFPADRLEVELTESILVADEMRADEQMKGLQALGIKVALDDFGTGYASLLYLRQFGFDKLKIDRNFVKDVDTSIQSKAMVISITSMSRALGLDVTAEGVENAAQHEFLKVAGCDRLQGFYFSQPVSAAALTSFLNTRHAVSA